MIGIEAPKIDAPIRDYDYHLGLGDCVRYRRGNSIGQVVGQTFQLRYDSWDDLETISVSGVNPVYLVAFGTANDRHMIHRIDASQLELIKRCDLKAPFSVGDRVVEPNHQYGVVTAIFRSNGDHGTRWTMHCSHNDRWGYSEKQIRRLSLSDYLNESLSWHNNDK